MTSTPGAVVMIRHHAFASDPRSAADHALELTRDDGQRVLAASERPFASLLPSQSKVIDGARGDRPAKGAPANRHRLRNAP